MTAGLAHHTAFEHLSSQHIASLALDVNHYRHKATGADHYHLACDSPENVFLVAVRTVPQNSTGVAHILEHTALCGSRRFPVRDPFFMMLRRSLNTFMNAFTSSDWTAYPFASQTPKDFDNLLQIYLDAVFFSNLDPLDFAQEGHRLELSDNQDLTSPLVYKGVVFNEMKGAMSSVNSLLWQALSAALFDNTYHYNSGGDPEAITELTYSELKQFYQKHYHPSNAIFMTFGDIPAAQHQERFETLALSEFDRSDAHIEVDLATPISEPLRLKQAYSLDDSDDLSAKTHLVMGWKLGESQNLMAQLEAHLVTNLLLENSASPLMAALETTDLGTAPSPLCGLEDSMREMVFCCGIAGSEVDRVDQLEDLILGVLRDCAQSDFAPEQIDAVLHQLELHQREITGDGMPYGLNLILQGLSAATHYGDPANVLDLDPALAKLKRNVEDPGYIQKLIKTLLLDNPHRVTLTLEPDNTLSSVMADREKQRLASIKAGLSPADLQAIADQAAALEARQSRADDSSILPKVSISDVPETLPEPSFTALASPTQTDRYPAGTNGLIYREWVAPLAQLNHTEMALLPLYTDFMTDVGLGKSDYLAVQQRQSACVGGINTHCMIRSAKTSSEQLEGYLAITSKALKNNAQAQLDLMGDTLSTVRFNERKRIKELVSQRTQRRVNGITGSGHSLAMSAAGATHSALANLQDQLGGLRAIQRLKLLDANLADDAVLDQLTQDLAALHSTILCGSGRHLIVAESQVLETLQDTMAHWTIESAANRQPLTHSPFEPASKNQLWLTNTSVYFCAKAYPTVTMEHPDGAALTVLGGLMRNGYLHRAIREQGGAYGGGASQDGSTGVFRFYSYRDPRLQETLTDFDHAISWAKQNSYSDEALEEAILGVIAAIDKPSSPAGACKQHFHNRLFGHTHLDRLAFRSRILACTRSDIERALETYFGADRASTAVVAPNATETEHSQWIRDIGMIVERI